jgi:hypothetical protein
MAREFAARSESGKLGRSLSLHAVENVQATLSRLRECALHHVPIDALDLDVHLQRRNPIGGARDLEVHVPEVILVSEDIRQDRHPIAVRDQAHRDPRDGRLDRNAGVHQRERTATNRRHRRRTIRLEGLRHDSDRVGEFLCVRQHGFDGALREVAVPDLSSTGPSIGARFTRRIPGEVVVEIEGLREAIGERIDRLCIETATEGRGHERLGLAAREQRHAVRARHDPQLTGDLANIRSSPPVDSLSGFENPIANGLGSEVVEDLLYVCSELTLCIAPRIDRLEAVEGDLLASKRAGVAVANLSFDFFDRVGALLLVLDLRGGFETGTHFAPDLLFERTAIPRRRQLDLRLADASLQILLKVDHPDQFAVGELEGPEDIILVGHVGAAFDHHQRLAAPADHEIHVALCGLLGRRIGDEFSADSTEPDGGDRPEKGNLRDGQGSRCADECGDVRCVLAIRRQDGRHDHRVVVVTLGEEGSDGPVDESTDQHFAIRQTRLALEESARNLARRGCLFDEVDRQRKEVDALARFTVYRGGQHDGLTVGDQARTSGLLGETSRLEGQGPATEFHRDRLSFEPIICHFFHISVSTRLMFLESDLQNSAGDET